MPATALQHFREDISRAQAILDHADPLPTTSDAERMLRSDLFRSAWMFAVGAVDAYFCDAYTDILAAALASKQRQPGITLPEFFYNIELPVRAILAEYTSENWKWRMAARKMMERKSVISLNTIKELFNRFFRKGFKFFHETLPVWMIHPEAKKRLFGVTAAEYLALTPADKEQAKQNAMGKLEDRFEKIFQRRNDCIHNCDRPRVRPQALATGGKVFKVIQDVEFLVNRCDEHINAEFREFLIGMGCKAATVAQAGY